MIHFVLVFNYSTNIRIITDIKKSRGNYFAIILPILKLTGDNRYFPIHVSLGAIALPIFFGPHL
mgnify:CR=1 FL=1